MKRKEKNVVKDEDSGDSKNVDTRSLENIKDEKQQNSKIFLVMSFFVPFLILGVVFIRAGVYPAGDKQVMYSDCKQQYLPFLKEFQRKLKSGDSLLYSWGNGFGTNFIAMIGYYIASPLNFLTLIVPVKYIREAMAVFMMIKVGCASLFTAMFLKHIYKRNDLSLVAFGCCYAFSDFILGYYWNVIWLDSVALLPLVALGMYCVIYENKYKTYIISLALAFVSSYYIGYMICLFAAIWFVILNITVVKERFKLVTLCENILKVALYSALALLMTMPVALPSLLQLQYTVGTNDAFPDKIELYENYAKIAANLLSFHTATRMEGLPNVGCGVICVLLVALFVRSKEIRLREKVTYIALLVFMFLSLNINVTDYIWHGFHYPNMIPYRYAFIFSFVLIVIAYRGFTVFDELTKKDISALCIMASLAVCVSVFYIDRKAVLGSVIAAALYIFFMLLYEMEMLDRRLLVVFVSLVMIAESCIRCGFDINENSTTDHEGYPEYEQQVTELLDYNKKNDPTDFYRTDQTDFSVKNDGMMYGYHGIGQFSSTSYKSLIEFAANFGMVSKRSSYQYLLTTPVVSMLENVKYVVCRDGYIADEKSLEYYMSSSDGKAAMYKNKYYLPIAYMADVNTKKIKLDYSPVFITQNRILRNMTGINKNVYDILEPTANNSQNITQKKGSGGVYTYRTRELGESTKIDVTYTAPKDGMMYAWADVDSSDYVQVKSKTINHSVYVESHRYIFPIGYYKKGETVSLNVEVSGNQSDKLAVAYLNEDVLDECYEVLSDEGLNVTNYSSTKIEGTIDVKSSGTFMTSIPYEKGWTMYVDGMKVNTEAAMGAFLSADLVQGHHEIKLVYMPEGFAAGCVMCFVGIAGFIGLLVFEKKNNKKAAKENYSKRQM